MGDDIAIGDVGAEVDVEGNRAVGGAAAFLAEDGEHAELASIAGELAVDEVYADPLAQPA